MIKIGKVQILEILRTTSIGVYLNSSDTGSKEDDILLPKKQVPEEAKIGDKIEVFVYRDSEDRLIATTNIPKLILNQIGLLKAVDITKIGAFMDWGLEKDLFLPYKEQTVKVVKDESYLVGLYLDKSQRLCATMKIHQFLKPCSEYNVGDNVTGIIYNIKPDLGALVAVEFKYYGLIPCKELYGKYKYGDEINARIIEVKEDGKLNLSLRQPSYLQIDIDAEFIFNKLLEAGDELPYNDKTEKDEIKEVFNMSKSSFKRALGRLFKEKKIEFTQTGIKKCERG